MPGSISDEFAKQRYLSRCQFMHMLALFALQMLTPSADAAREARATVRIVRAARATSEEWGRSERRYERITEEEGRPIRLRLLEFE